MIQIEDKIVSRDILEVQFVCDYEACRGVCCVEGDSGAPLEHAEAMTMRHLLPLVEPLLSADALAVIHSKGISYTDASGDEVTQLVNGRDCVFTTYDEEGRCLCACRGGIDHATRPYSGLLDCYCTFYGTQYYIGTCRGGMERTSHGTTLRETQTT